MFFAPRRTLEVSVDPRNATIVRYQVGIVRGKIVVEAAPRPRGRRVFRHRSGRVLIPSNPAGFPSPGSLTCSGALEDFCQILEPRFRWTTSLYMSACGVHSMRASVDLCLPGDSACQMVNEAPAPTSTNSTIPRTIWFVPEIKLLGAVSLACTK